MLATDNSTAITKHTFNKHTNIQFSKKNKIEIQTKYKINTNPNIKTTKNKTVSSRLGVLATDQLNCH